ncbi:hypothetical protein As57867_001904, partial [Aphanomyces stellatus]
MEEAPRVTTYAAVIDKPTKDQEEKAKSRRHTLWLVAAVLLVVAVAIAIIVAVVAGSSNKTTLANSAGKTVANPSGLDGPNGQDISNPLGNNGGNGPIKGGTAASNDVTSNTRAIGICSTLQANIDYQGHDLTSTFRTAATDCCGACAATANCQLFVWKQNVCYLKSSGAQAMTSDASNGLLAGSLLPPSTTSVPSSTCLPLQPNMDYAGHDLNSTQRASASQCCNDCVVYPNCQLFVWKQGVCYLKSGGATAAQSDPSNGLLAGAVQTPVPTSQPTTTVAPLSPAPSTPSPPPTPVTTTAPSPSCSPLQPNIDYGGHDLNSTQRSSASLCCGDCIAYPNCQTFVWKQGVCYLKSGGAAPSQSDVSNGLQAGTIQNGATPPPSSTKNSPPTTPATTNASPSTTAKQTTAPVPPTTTSTSSKTPPPPIYGRINDGTPGTDLNEVTNPSSYPNRGCKLPNYLSQQGQLFVQAPNGGPQISIGIKGINWFGLETIQNAPFGLWANPQNGTSIYEIAAFLARNKFNSVRLPLTVESLLKNTAPNLNLINTYQNPTLNVTTYTAAVSAIIKALAFRGISVLLDIHYLSATADSGTWFSGAFPESSILSAIDTLTRNFCNDGHWNVLGVDLKNEPHDTTWGDFGPADMRVGAAKMGNRILSSCSSWLVFVEGNAQSHNIQFQGQNFNYYDWWGGGLQNAGRFPLALNLPHKIVYAPHFYSPSVYPQTWLVQGGSRNGDTIVGYQEYRDSQLSAIITATCQDMFGYLRETQDYAIVFGEFGGLYAKDDDTAKTSQRITR